MKRREFLKSLAGGTVLLLPPLRPVASQPSDAAEVNSVPLGRTGLRVSQLAWGTGTRGWKYRSDQTTLGQKEFRRLAFHAYDLGIRFFDTADIYGSHSFVRLALRELPRDRLVIMTKIWTASNDWIRFEGVERTLTRFRKELGTDYFDIVLLHCQVTSEWPRELEEARAQLEKAKERGLVRSHGVSCHSLDALKAAAQDPWTEVILARINHRGVRMDGQPEEVLQVLREAHRRGKGIIGMKIFGCGDLRSKEEREASLRFVLESRCVDAMSIGFTTADQMTEVARLVRRLSREQTE